MSLFVDSVIKGTSWGIAISMFEIPSQTIERGLCFSEASKVTLTADAQLQVEATIGVDRPDLKCSRLLAHPHYTLDDLGRQGQRLHPAAETS